MVGSNDLNCIDASLESELLHFSEELDFNVGAALYVIALLLTVDQHLGCFAKTAPGNRQMLLAVEARGVDHRRRLASGGELINASAISGHLNQPRLLRSKLVHNHWRHASVEPAPA